MRLILASASPRRRELLAQIGLDCEVAPSHVDETVRYAESAIAYTERLAREKARVCLEKCGEGAIVLAADTTVSVDGELLGKPRDRDHALAMLSRLSGRAHDVVTAFAVLVGAREVGKSVTTKVWMATSSAVQREMYWNSGEPRDKAGGYAIQGRGAVLVERIEGSYSNVVGLPLFEVACALRGLGVAV